MFQRDICTYAWWMVDFPNWIKFQLKIYIFCDEFRLLFFLQFRIHVCSCLSLSPILPRPAKMKLKTPLLMLQFLVLPRSLNFAVNVLPDKTRCSYLRMRVIMSLIELNSYRCEIQPKLNCDSVKIPTFINVAFFSLYLSIFLSLSLSRCSLIVLSRHTHTEKSLLFKSGFLTLVKDYLDYSHGPVTITIPRLYLHLHLHLKPNNNNKNKKTLH